MSLQVLFRLTVQFGVLKYSPLAFPLGKDGDCPHTNTLGEQGHPLTYCPGVELVTLGWHCLESLSPRGWHQLSHLGAQTWGSLGQ